ncbi:matrix extracellular phosphoglycoprotein [Macaca thibetana thibetana]|uniref:matrix extracellular phosphoglycoprotein n=1 Tax=Macaca thibetana thibetana TaxID=257877 RepID=UPI0021BCF1F0|nr:matrix extracellular phosphoglycoprotein [Macaca thibetana thibetana]
MRVFCVGLLFLSVTWAAPTFQPQTEKTKQSCVEEQRITYKGHHEKHGHYVFKCVYMSPGKKNQTDVKQEEKNKGNIGLHHLGKRRYQELSSKENIVQERKKDLSLSEASENNGSSKSQNYFTNRQRLNKEYSISNKENIHNGLRMSIYPKSTGNKQFADGDDAISKLHDQEEYGAALIRNNMQHIVGPVTAIKLLGEENKQSKPKNVLNKIPASMNYAKAHSKDKKKPQRDSQVQKVPVKSKSTHRTQHNIDYPKHLSKVKKIPSDFEGSGYTDLQERGDNDMSPFSGDGQPFKDIPGKGEATGPDLEGKDIQTGFAGPSEAESTNLDTKEPGYNEIPEREENGGNTIGTGDETAKEADAVDVSLVEGNNDIMGSTNFKELPGREGNRVDVGGQNAHQGKVEFHYPPAPSKEKRKEGSSDATESTNYNEIPKNDKGSARKGVDDSNRNQAILHEKQRFPSKGKSQGLPIPSRGLDNEIKTEMDSLNGPSNENIPHSRKYHYVPHRQNNPTRNKGMPHGKGSWGRQPYSNRRLSSRRREDSSESSDSGSSSESDGD